MRRASVACMLVCMGLGVANADEVAPSAKEVRPLLVGAAVPDVPVQTIEGQTVQLPEALGGKPTVLIFFRGGW